MKKEVKPPNAVKPSKRGYRTYLPYIEKPSPLTEMELEIIQDRLSKPGK